MINELIFVVHCFVCAAASVIALIFGPYVLCSLIAFQCVISNLLVLKQTILFGFVATCADPFTVGATIGFNLLQEFYGKALARKTIFITFFLLVFYTVVTHIHLWYAPAPVDYMHEHYQQLFAIAPRIVGASLATYTIVQWLDYFIYGFLKVWFNNRLMYVRTFLSTIICQAVDTILFTFLGLANIVSNPWDVVFVSYGIKLLATIFAIVFVKTLCFMLPFHANNRSK